MNSPMLQQSAGLSAKRLGVARAIRAEASGPDFALKAFDFVAKCHTSGKSADLIEHFLSLVVPIGIERVAMLDIWRAEPDIAASIRFTTFDPQWVKRYIRERQDHRDPIWHSAALASRSMRWSKTWADPRVDDLAMIENYHNSGLLDGLTVPVYNSFGQKSSVFLGASRQLTLDPAAEAALTLAAGALGSFAIDAMPPPPSSSRLTIREREVLTLTAVGKSARQIGLVLGVSETTVARHLLNIRMKLHSANTVQAVVRAIKEQIIVV